LQLASTQGTIQFVLRNGTDKTNVDIHPTRVDQLIASATPPAPPKTNRPARRAPVASQPMYVLEVIQGTQKTVHTFDEAKRETGKQQ
jgi:hypothetical protein